MKSGDKEQILEAMDCEVISNQAFDTSVKVADTASNSSRETKASSLTCCTVCDKIVNYLWTTRTKIDGKKSNADIFIMTTLRELLIYFIFLTLLILISFGMVTLNSYYYAASMENVFINDGFDFDNIKGLQFNTITTTRQFWEYLENQLPKYLFWKESWVNDRPETETEGSIMYYEIKLIGVARLRQVRSKIVPCHMPSFMRTTDFPCYQKYFPESPETNPMRNNYSMPGWTYTSSSDSKAEIYYGSISTYDGGGYIIDLTTEYNSTKAIISALKEQTWIDRGTRAVFIDFVVFNVNLNLFCKIRMVAEFPNFGGAVTAFSITPSKLLRYTSAFDYFILSCEILFILFVIYYLIEVFLEFLEIKWKMFKNFWSLLDMMLVLMSMVCISFNIFRIIYVNQQLTSVINVQDRYPQFDKISTYDKLYQHMIAINVFISILKIFKYIRFNKAMAHFSSTLGSSAKEIFGFSVMFLIVYIAFAQLAYLLFGAMAFDYSGLQTSILSQFRIILGDFNFQDLENANGSLGAIYFVIYVFFVFFVLINMFVAIICDNYMKVKYDEKINKEVISISNFFKSKTDAVMERFKVKTKKIMDIQDAINIGDLNNDSFLAFDEWRVTMKQKGYADCEIEAAFSKYDLDGDQVLDPYEQKLMREQLEAEKKKISESLNSEKRLSLKHSSVGSQSALRDSAKEECVTSEEISFLNTRVVEMEANIQLILEKLHLVLNNVECLEKQKLSNQKGIGKIIQLLESY